MNWIDFFIGFACGLLGGGLIWAALPTPSTPEAVAVHDEAPLVRKKEGERGSE